MAGMPVDRRKASNLAPDQPDLLDTLAVIESINGDHQTAQHTIQRALAARPDDLSMRYHEAMIVAAEAVRATVRSLGPVLGS